MYEVSEISGTWKHTLEFSTLVLLAPAMVVPAIMQTHIHDNYGLYEIERMLMDYSTTSKSYLLIQLIITAI